MNLAGYLARIGFTGTPAPDLETLKTLHLLHPLNIPFENLTPFTHQEVSLSLPDLEEKFLARHRGGYCFEQNIFFAEVLRQIGFKVVGLGARVLWNQPEELITRRSHMLLLVWINNERFIVDVGFGGLTLTAPLRFITGIEQSTPHELFRLEPMDQDLKLQARIKTEWKTLYRFDMQEQFLVDYEVANHFLYTHPSSIFRNILIAAKPLQKGRMALRNDQFTSYNEQGEAAAITLSSANDIKTILREKFDISWEGEESLNKRMMEMLSAT